MKPLAGDKSTHYRTTDHAEEVAWLRAQGAAERDELTRFAYLAAADLLEVHDSTGLSLDDWSGPRDLVEFLLKRNILRNGV